MTKTQKRSDKDHRKQISPLTIGKVDNDLMNELRRRLEEKGYGAWLSRHEILGILTEEMKEIVDAVHNGTKEELEGELFDVAVGCVFAIACIREGALDW